jgi:uncharacterized protein YciI
MNAGRKKQTITLKRSPMRRSICRTFIGIMLFFSIAAVILAQDAPSAPKNSQAPRAYQHILFKLGPAWVKDKALFMQPGIQEHAAYMSKLMKEGILILGGPLFEDEGLSIINGGAMILAAETPAAARKLLEIDPAQRSGLFEIVDIRPLMITGGTCHPSRTQ